MPSAIAEQHGWLRKLIDGVDANIWEADPRTLQRSFVSRYAEELLGYPAERWLREPGFWRSVVFSEDRQKTIESSLAAIEKNDRYALEYRMVTANGLVLWVRDSVRVERDGRGKAALLRGVMTDITSLRNAEERLRLSEERQRMIVENARDFAIFSIDVDGKITSWNSGAENLFGFAEPEALGRPSSILFTPEDNERGDAQRELQRALTSDRAVNERFHIHKSGRRFWGSGLMMAAKDERGRTVGAIKIVRDATEQRHAAEEIRALNSELELRVAERTAQLESANRELESFSYSVSHDLHAPLRKIDGYTRIVLQDHGDALGEEGRRSLQKVRQASQQMSRLIDDMLNLARVVRGVMHRERVDVTALARSVARELEASQTSPIPCRVASDLVADADPDLLRIVLFNLIENACKFSAKSSSPQVEVGAEGDVFFVRDNGAGFDMAYADKLFREFSRLHEPREYPGTGIGLATVRRIVNRHGGEVWAHGAPERGATFYFTLAARQAPEARP